MCSKISTSRSTETSSPGEALRRALDGCEAVVVGAGAGLSVSAGLTYKGPRFQRYFSDFAAQYGIGDMYAGGFYPFPTQEEYWAWWSRHIMVNRYEPPPKPVYDDLLALVGEKDYFVLTTNVDHCFQRAGFDKERLFYTQGDYGLFQCARPCHQSTYDNEAVIREMVARQRDMRVPTALVPRCPKCGGPLVPNLRCDDTFVQDAGWYAAAARYEDFLRRHGEGKVLFLELGVGWNTPGIIKYPFWRMTAANPKAAYVRVDLNPAAGPEEIEARSLALRGDIGAVLWAARGRR